MLPSTLRHELPIIIQNLHREFRVLHRHDFATRPSKLPKQNEQFILNFSSPASALTNAVQQEFSRRRSITRKPIIISVQNALSASGTAPASCESIFLNIESPDASAKFQRVIGRILPNSPTDNVSLFHRGLEQHNLLGAVDYVHNVLVDMRNDATDDGRKPCDEWYKCSFLSRKCLDLSKSYWGPTTVVLCALWDGSEARELLNHCRYRFRRVFYLVQPIAESRDASELLLLNEASKGSFHGFNAFESEKYLGFPSYLICQFPDHMLLDVIDRRATRKHPTGRENTHLLPIRRPKWLHQGAKYTSKMKPISFTASRPAFGDPDGGTERTRLRYEEKHRYQELSRNMLHVAKNTSPLRSKRPPRE